MSKKIKINKAIGGHAAGDTITVTNGVADYLEAAGLTDKPKAATKKTNTKADDDAD